MCQASLTFVPGGHPPPSQPPRGSEVKPSCVCVCPLRLRGLPILQAGLVRSETCGGPRCWRASAVFPARYCALGSLALSSAQPLTGQMFPVPFELGLFFSEQWPKWNGKRAGRRGGLAAGSAQPAGRLSSSLRQAGPRQEVPEGAVPGPASLSAVVASCPRQGGSVASRMAACTSAEPLCLLPGHVAGPAGRVCSEPWRAPRRLWHLPRCFSWPRCEYWGGGAEGESWPPNPHLPGSPGAGTPTTRRSVVPGPPRLTTCNRAARGVSAPPARLPHLKV